MMKATVLLIVLSCAQEYQAFRHFEKREIKALNSGDVVPHEKYIKSGGESLKLGNDNVRSGDEDMDNEGTLKIAHVMQIEKCFKYYIPVSCFFCRNIFPIFLF